MPGVGEVSERLKEHAWKVCVRYAYRGFESLPLRQLKQYSPGVLTTDKEQSAEKYPYNLIRSTPAEGE
jgi:hypothetical protein